VNPAPGFSGLRRAHFTTSDGESVVAGLRFSSEQPGWRDTERGESNCLASPEPLLERELFGHEKGAFSGAERKRIGKFEQCHGGTIFLDEVGEMSSPTQAKIFRLIQEQRFEQLGGSETVQTDVRLVAATNAIFGLDRGQFGTDCTNHEYVRNQTPLTSLLACATWALRPFGCSLLPSPSSATVAGTLPW